MLPKLNDIPKYEIEVPSTGKKHRFRPFLVKEEKVLLLALESDDGGAILGALVDTLDSCIEDINTRSLTSFDIEYLFLKVRAKSVGETSKIMLECSECKEHNEYMVNFDELKMDVPKLDPIIVLDDNISIEMQWPSWEQIQSIVTGNTENLKGMDYIFMLLRAALKTVMTEDERIDLKDVSPEEINDFIDSMNTTQLNMIKDYVEAMPSLKEDVKFDCVKCGHHNAREIRGLQSFFS